MSRSYPPQTVGTRQGLGEITNLVHQLALDSEKEVEQNRKNLLGYQLLSQGANAAAASKQATARPTSVAFGKSVNELADQLRDPKFFQMIQEALAVVDDSAEFEDLSDDEFCKDKIKDDYHQVAPEYNEFGYAEASIRRFGEKPPLDRVQNGLFWHRRFCSQTKNLRVRRSEWTDAKGEKSYVHIAKKKVKRGKRETLTFPASDIHGLIYALTAIQEELLAV